MIENKFDVSAYCQDSLVTSFDHLTSIEFALFSLIRPALKIATRSFFIERQDLTFSRILSQLNDETPITPTQNESTSSENNRTFFQRLVYFLTVGIPLALLVGILAGLIHFVKTVFNDILNIISILKKFYIMSRADIRFYSGIKSTKRLEQIRRDLFCFVFRKSGFTSDSRSCGRRCCQQRT